MRVGSCYVLMEGRQLTWKGPRWQRHGVIPWVLGGGARSSWSMGWSGWEETTLDTNDWRQL